MVINMIYMININTEIFLRSVKDLNKLKLLVEVNNLDRPNFSAIACYASHEMTIRRSD